MDIDPPRFTSQNFERYKLELQAWSEVTNVSKAKQGALTALSLPEDDQFQNIARSEQSSHTPGGSHQRL